MVDVLIPPRVVVRGVGLVNEVLIRGGFRPLGARGGGFEFGLRQLLENCLGVSLEDLSYFFDGHIPNRIEPGSDVAGFCGSVGRRIQESFIQAVGSTDDGFVCLAGIVGDYGGGVAASMSGGEIYDLVIRWAVSRGFDAYNLLWLFVENDLGSQGTRDVIRCAIGLICDKAGDVGV